MEERVVTNRDVVRVMFQHVWRYKGHVLLVLVAISLATVADVVQPWFMKRFIDQLSSPPSAVDPILVTLYALLGLQLLNWIGWRVSGFVTVDFEPRVMRDLEQTGFENILGHSHKFFTDTFSGALVRKIGRMSRAFEAIMDQFQFRFIPLFIILVGTCIGLFLRSPVIALAFIAWVVLFVYFNIIASRWKLKIDLQRASADSEVTGVLADALSNSNNIKLFTGAKDEADRFFAVKEKWRRLQARGWGRGETIFAVQGILMVFIEFGLMFGGTILWSKGIFTVGDLVLIQSYLGVALGRMWDLGRSFRNVYEAFADARELVQILETPYDVRDRRGAKGLKVKRGLIEFKNVSFHFNETRKVLDTFSLSIQPGEKVALIGPSGAGKSTITKLLFRFYDVDAGAILIDGQDISRVTQESLRKNIALVPQEPILFHRTVMENIRYGRRDATDKEVLDASHKAHCHEFISELPKGYETLVGERGVKLSGGERQRVAIARAILKDAPILVLDEATSSLDSESEHLIQDALRILMEGKTSIAIAHRLSTIMQMDRIFVIENGRVADQGTHEDLLKRKGVYRRLWEIQAGGFIK
jgi:ATP-binding cassette, subfamily B, bacterial